MSINQNFPNVWPSLVLDFENSKTLDPRITFTRSSTATYVGSDGLIKTAAADEARFDHNPETGESLGLLIEESRTNLAPYSQELNAATWNKYFGSSVSANYAIAPDGTQTADRIIFNGNQYGQLALNLANVLTVGEQYIYSVWAKSDGSSTAATLLYVNGYYVSLNVTSEWKRFQVAYTATSTSAALLFLCSSQVNSLLVWGVQFEKGSFPTSYIPTSGSAVTRQPDNASITGTNFSSWYNQSKGTFFGYADIINSKYNDAISGYDGNNNNYTILGTGDSPNRFQLRFDDIEPFQVLAFGPNSTSVLTANLTIFPSLTAKIAGAIRQNDSAGAAQGQIIVTDTSIDMISPSALYLGTLSGSSEILNGHLKQLRYYPERLTNTQLQNLTK